MRIALTVMMAGLLAGCTSAGQDPFLQTGAIAPTAPPMATEVGPAYAAAYLPGVAGGIQSVRQTVHADTLKQDVIYADSTSISGENKLTVDVGRAAADTRFLRAPSEREIVAAINASFSGIHLAISPVIGQNRYGIYGYAAGKTGDTACVYAWQLVRDVAPEASADMRKLGHDRFAAQVRLRYCRASITPDKLAEALMQGLTVKPIDRDTLKMLQFASGTGQTAMAPAIIETQTPVAAAPAEEQPVLRTHAAAAKSIQTADVAAIDNAIAVPLPHAADDQAPAANVPATPKKVVKKTTVAAAQIPLPE